jgi:hypothetical protein
MPRGNESDQVNRSVGRRGGAGRTRGRGECGGMGRGSGAGSRGRCVCPKCGHTEEHVPGVPCMQERCSDCGAAMVREGSPHHQQILARRAGPEERGDAQRKGDG